MEVGNESLDVRESEFEARIVAEYSPLNLEELQVELDAVERQMPSAPQEAREMERREQILRSVVESAIEHGYLSSSQEELREALEEVQSQIAAAQVERDGVGEVRHLGRVEQVLLDMIEDW